MRYEQVKKGIFLARPNRFIAHVLVDDTETVCRVKNTGRCRELLVPGAAVYLEKGTNPNRKTAYDLIAVEKNGKLINMDAQAPNKVFAEWALQFDPTATAVHSEYRFGQSRLDFCLETPRGLHLVEVKGVTLEEGGHARRLMGVHYLITGQNYSAAVPLPANIPCTGSWREVLRLRYHEESCSGLNYRRASEETTDECLSEILLELSHDEYRHARQLLCLLEKQMPI